MFNALSKQAVQSFVDCKIAKLNQLLRLSQDTLGTRRSFDRTLSAFLSEIFDEFGYSVSTPGLHALTSGAGALRNLNNLYAATYGAAAARVGVSGSSSSNLAVLGILTKMLRNGRSIVLCDAFAHQSAFGGLVISGLDSVFIPRDICHRTGAPKSMSPERVEEMLREYGSAVAAVFVTSPTYEGFDSDISEIRRLCDVHDVLLIIDGAWASPYGLDPEFPPAQIASGHIVVTSPHKSGLAPCQISLVLFEDVDLAKQYDRVCELGFATTSPNQLLLMIAEHRLLETRESAGGANWERAARFARDFALAVKDVSPDLSVIRPSEMEARSSNPVHVLLDTSAIPIDARDWAKMLADRHMIDVEFAAECSMLFLFGRGAREPLGALIQKMKSSLFDTLARSNAPIHNNNIAYTCSSPPCLPVNARGAFFSAIEGIELECSIGRQTHVAISFYPPDRPILYAGQTIRAEDVRAIQLALSKNTYVTGLTSTIPPRLDVIRQPTKLLVDRSVKVVNQDPETISAEYMNQYAGLFRETFCNSPFDQFAFDPKESTIPISVHKIAGSKDVSSSAYVDLKTLDEFELPHPLKRWIDPGICESQLANRCRDIGYMSLAVEEPTGCLVGVVHSRVTSLERLFDTEEWSNHLLLADHKNAGEIACKDAFLAKVDYHFHLKPTDSVFTVSTMAVHPDYRGKSHLFFDLMASMARNIRPEHRELPMIAEIPDAGAARVIDIASNERLIHGMLKNGHDIVFTPRLENAMRHYLQGRKYFRELLRGELRYRKLLFRPQISDNPDVEVKSMDGIGLGVFAVRDIEPNTTIAVFEGERYESGSALGLPEQMVDHAIQISNCEFVHGANGLAELCNHSCSPNSGIRNLVEIFAARRILAGEQVCWDYRCSEDSDWTLNQCQCGSDQCSGTIMGFGSLREEIKSEYLNRGMVSEWIVEKHGS